MFLTFAQSIYKKLIENEFYNISKKEYGILTEDTVILEFRKSIGPILYIVNIFNIDKFVLNSYEQYIENFKNLIYENLNTIDAQHIITLNIFAYSNENEEMLEFIKSEEFYADKSIHMIFWAVDLKNKNILIPQNQTDKILNLFQIVEYSLNSEHIDNEAVYTNDLERQAIDENVLKPKTSNAYITYIIIALNIFIWAFMHFGRLNTTLPQTILNLGANSREFIIIYHQYWRLFTSMFIHIELSHLMFNCFALFLFGIRVEKYFGKSRFLILYIISGIAGSFVSIIFNTTSSIGASGAIYGIMGAALALSEQTKKELDGLSFYSIAVIAVTSIAFSFLNEHIDNFAHIGGMIAGYTLGFILCPNEYEI